MFTIKNNNTIRQIKTRAYPQVFQVTPPITRISYNDINDAIDASKKLSEKDKKEYFYSIGINYDNVKKYYNYILTLEYLYK
jgi:hypothetical protein